jgi:3-hydroxyisobutyrate dehydrogenase
MESTHNDRDHEPRVAILGTGTMGSAMARRLLGAGLQVDVWNRSPQSAQRLAADGATAHTDPGEAVAHADVLITTLVDGATVTSVVAEQGVLAALPSGAVWAQMSTVGTKATSDLARLAADRRPDVRFVDAPVSGSRGPAEAGQLLVLASGPDTAKAVLAPVFDAIGRGTMWLGDAGKGSALKLVLNTWLAFLVEGIAESAALADDLGLPLEALRDGIVGGPLDAPLAITKLDKIRSGDYAADFTLGLATKDVRLATGDAEQAQLPIAAAIAQRWSELLGQGLGDEDVSVVRRGLT